jgi:hypothetical protein
MNIKNCKTFKSEVVIGLYKSYTSELISPEEFNEALLQAQQAIKRDLDILLSAKTRMCQIQFLGQQEPSMELQFIQYPKFIVDELVLKEAIIKLVENIMIKLEQNRVVIVFTDETIMLEQTADIDSNINLP